MVTPVRGLDHWQLHRASARRRLAVRLRERANLQPMASADQRLDLRPTLRAVVRFQEQSTEAVEEGVETSDADDDLVASRRPLLV